MRFILRRNIYFKLKPKSVKRNKSKLKIRIFESQIRLNSIPQLIIYVVQNTFENKRKVKIFMWFLTLNFRLDQRNKRQLISKEKHCCYDGLPWPKKRLPYKKCFVLPEVNLKVKPNFIVLGMFTTLDKAQNKIHLK